MSDTAAPETPVAAPEGHADASSGEGQGIVPADAPKGNREARYRTERNDAREALATATARIDGMQARDVERIAGKLLSAPGDLLTLSGKTVADFRDENGDIDPELVEDAATEVLAARPGLRPNVGATDLSQGHGNSHVVSSPSWSDLLKGANGSPVVTMS